MKKFLAILLAMLLMLVTMSALAEEPEVDIGDAVDKIVSRDGEEEGGEGGEGESGKPTAAAPAITKVYTIESGLSFSETLNFTVACTDKPEGVTTAPMITVGDEDAFTYAVGTDASAYIPINFPTYEVAGTYTYTVTEQTGTVQGTTTYDTNTVYVKVYVVYNGDELVPTANVWIGGDEVEEQKTDTITNIYEVGDLKVGKEIKGSLADPDKDFTIVVTFTKTGEAKTSITVNTTDGKGTSDKPTVAPSAWDGDTATVTLTLKDGQYVIFENIPYGVSYTVEETGITEIDDATEEPNDPNAYKVEYTGATGSIESESAEATVTNSKDLDVPTGIALDTLPYVMILAFALLGLMMTARRREDF